MSGEKHREKDLEKEARKLARRRKKLLKSKARKGYKSPQPGSDEEREDDSVQLKVDKYFYFSEQGIKNKGRCRPAQGGLKQTFKPVSKTREGELPVDPFVRDASPEMLGRARKQMSEMTTYMTSFYRYDRVLEDQAGKEHRLKKILRFSEEECPLLRDASPAELTKARTLNLKDAFKRLPPSILKASFPHAYGHINDASEDQAACYLPLNRDMSFDLLLDQKRKYRYNIGDRFSGSSMMVGLQEPARLSKK